MKTLIIKLGATGDVVRTTTLLHILDGEIYWLTLEKNIELIASLPQIHKPIPWNNREVLFGEFFNLVINLEDSKEASSILNQVNFDDLFGAFIDNNDLVKYTDNSSDWFDLSIISRYGKTEADRLKYENRHSYQTLIFRGLGFKFNNEPYLLPETKVSDLHGDIAIAPESGAVWPMKNWAYFAQLKSKLESEGFYVNYLPLRKTIIKHIADVKNHSYLISGDSLPMHIALGSGIKCTSIFICTSPWEIHDYGLMQKVVSPTLQKYFYRRDFDPTASKSLILNDVYKKIILHFNNLTSITR